MLYVVCETTCTFYTNKCVFLAWIQNYVFYYLFIVVIILIIHHVVL